GEPDLALVEAFSGLADRFDSQVPALFSRLAGRPLFSIRPNAMLSDTLIAHGLVIIKRALPDRAPILRPVFHRYVKVLRRIRVENIERLPAAQRRDYDQALSRIDELCREVLERSFQDVASDQRLPAYDLRCPFRGLAAFNPFRPKQEDEPHDDPAQDPRFF